MEDSPQPDKLKRTLSLSLLTFYGIGTILGMGIYVLLGKIGGEAGTLAPFAFLVAAFLAGFTALSFGELVSRMPSSAGEVRYVQTAFNRPWLSTVVGWLIVCSATVSTSTMVNGYVGYVQVFVDWPGWVIISVLTISLGAVAVKGIKESAWLVMGITIIELSGIFFVIFISGDHLADLPARIDEFIPDFNIADWKLVSMGAFLAFFAFIGFEDLVNVSEEVKNARRNVPLAIIISLAVLSVLYVVIALIAGLALTPAELDQSTAPLADVVALKGPTFPKIIGLISLVAIVNGVLVQIIMGARVMYGMAEKKLAPPIFGKLNRRTKTPVWGTAILVGAILVLANTFELESLAQTTNYILLFVFTLVNASLVVIKRRGPAPKGVITFPIWVPVMGFIFSIVIVVIQIVSELSAL